MSLNTFKRPTDICELEKTVIWKKHGILMLYYTRLLKNNGNAFCS